MIALVIRDKFLNPVKKAIQDLFPNSSFENLFSFINTDQLDSEGIKNAFASIYRLKPGLIILDLDIAPEADILNSLNNYQILNKETRKNILKLKLQY